MSNPIRIVKGQGQYSARNPTEAFMQHLTEVAAVHWPHKELSSKGKGKTTGKPVAWFNRQTASSPMKNHRTAPKKKYTS